MAIICQKPYPYALMNKILVVFWHWRAQMKISKRKKTKKTLAIRNDTNKPWSDAELDAYRIQEHAIGIARRQQMGAREEGREEGLIEGRQEIAKKLLLTKMKIEQIANITGLSLEQIKALRKSQ